MLKLPKISLNLRPNFDIWGLVLKFVPRAQEVGTKVVERGGLNNVVSVTAVALITFGLFWLSAIQATEPFKLHIALIAFLVFVGHRFFGKGLPEDKKTRYDYISLLLFLALVVSIVAATGRFLSPFFFSLYLMAIILAFIFNLFVAFAFLATLIVLFSFNIGEVDITYDFLTLLSLLAVVPIAVFVRKQFIQQKARRKEILVLQDEEKKYYQSVVDEVLSNVITETVTSLRQSATYIKQATSLLRGGKISKVLWEKYLERIASSSEEILERVKKFEEDATGKKLLSAIKSEEEKESPQK